jgi:hypothetical protein
MNFQHYFEKLTSSKEFQKFKKEFPKAYFCSGFFAIDKEGNDNQENLDYYEPELKRVFSFKLHNGVELIPVENIEGASELYVPEQLKDNYDFTFDFIENLVQGEMFDKKVNKKITKMLFSMQAKEGKGYLLGTIFLAGLGLFKITIGLDDKRVVDSEKKSFFDMISIVKKDQ